MKEYRINMINSKNIIYRIFHNLKNRTWNGKKNESYLRNFQVKNRKANIRIFGSQIERTASRTKKKKFKEIMGENFLNLAKDLTLQIQEAEQTPSRLKTKKKTLKAARDKSCIIYGEDQFKLGHI